MKAGPSPEISLLQLACTVEVSAEKKAQLSQFLNQNRLNWGRLYKLAERHRLTPFLYNCLQSVADVPADFLLALRSSYQVAAADNLIKRHEYQILKQLLTNQGIDHIAYKGIYLAEHCYPEGSLRISGDIDVLIRPEDAFRTIQLLRQHQYQLNEKHTLYFLDGEQRLLNELSEVSLFKPFFNDTYFDIDLHWKILCFNKDFAAFELPDVLNQPIFQTEMQVILLVTHHGVTNVWQQLFYINDLYFLLNNKSIDWSWLLNQMRQYGMEQLFLVGLFWCREIWSLTLPASVQVLVDSAHVQKLARTYEQNWEIERPVDFSKLVLKQLLYFVRAQTQFSQIVKIYVTFITSRVFRASTFRLGKRLIFVPKEFGMITFFIRAIRSLFRFLPSAH